VWGKDRGDHNKKTANISIASGTKMKYLGTAVTKQGNFDKELTAD
jgi:hypothetical protein